MPRNEHVRPINVLPMTLGPHGANFHDVMEVLTPMKALDQGITVEINGNKILLYTPIIAFTSNMLQQLDNSGCLGMVATLSCRNCKITIDTRHDLDFDILSQMRAHMEMMRLHKALDGKRTKREKQAFSTL